LLSGLPPGFTRAARAGVNLMLNWSIASVWQNWFIVFLMIAIVLVGLHVVVDHADKN